MKDNKNILLTVRVDKGMNEQLKALAEASKRTLSDYVRQILEVAAKKKTKV